VLPWLTIMQDSDRTIEVDSETHTDYVFHRHSAPKDVVYYRCSDKLCKARLHFNMITKQLAFKNQHLEPSVHRQPRSPLVISVDQPCDGGVRRCISTHSFSALPNDPSAPKPSQPTVPPPFISQRVRPDTLIRVYCESLPAAHDLCRTAVLKHQAVRASCLENAIVYSVENGAKAVDYKAAIADLEFTQAAAEEFVVYARATFPPGIRISVFKH